MSKWIRNLTVRKYWITTCVLNVLNFKKVIVLKIICILFKVALKHIIQNIFPIYAQKRIQSIYIL